MLDKDGGMNGMPKGRGGGDRRSGGAVTETITITRDELRQIVREAVNEAFLSVGLRAEDEEAVENARSDFAFIRRFRRAIERTASTIGMAVVLAIVGGVITLLSLGARALLMK